MDMNMINVQLDAKITELMAEHSYLLSALKIAELPADRLPILEALERCRNRLRDDCAKRIDEIREHLN